MSKVSRVYIVVGVIHNSHQLETGVEFVTWGLI